MARAKRGKIEVKWFFGLVRAGEAASKAEKKKITE